MNRTTFFAGSTFFLLLAAQAQAQSTTLQVGVFSPAPPILPTDIVSLYAFTPVEVFPDTGHVISSTFSLNGFDIEWDITSMDRGGVVLDVLERMDTINDVGPLSAGTYHVVANWNHVGPGLLIGAPSSGTGSTTFTVVPEPGTGLLVAVGAMLAAHSRWRRWERTTSGFRSG